MRFLTAGPGGVAPCQLSAQTWATMALWVQTLMASPAEASASRSSTTSMGVSATVVRPAVVEVPFDGRRSTYVRIFNAEPASITTSAPVAVKSPNRSFPRSESYTVIVTVEY